MTKEYAISNEIDPEGTPLTLRGFDTPGKAKQTARERVKDLNIELRDMLRQKTIDQRRKMVVEEEGISNDPNESADAIHAEMSLEKHLNEDLNDLLGDEIEKSYNLDRADEAMDEDLRKNHG